MTRGGLPALFAAPYTPMSSSKLLLLSLPPPPVPRGAAWVTTAPATLVRSATAAEAAKAAPPISSVVLRCCAFALRGDEAEDENKGTHGLLSAENALNQTPARPQRAKRGEQRRQNWRAAEGANGAPRAKKKMQSQGWTPRLPDFQRASHGYPAFLSRRAQGGGRLFKSEDEKPAVHTSICLCITARARAGRSQKKQT